MNCWKCDVCGRLGESFTSQLHVQRLPRGWLTRVALVDLPGEEDMRAEVEVHVCSDECAKQYDKIELERSSVKVRWTRRDVVTGDVEPIHPLKP